MTQRAEIIVIPADVAPAKGWQIFWAFSKKQLDMVLQEVELVEVGAAVEDFILSRAFWQEEKLAVVSLEKYFGMPQLTGSQVDKCAVLKDVVDKGSGPEVGRIMVKISGNIRVREVDFMSMSTSPSMLPARQEDVHGVYSLSDKQLLVVPNLEKIYANCLG